MWVEFNLAQPWQFKTCLSTVLSVQLGVQVWCVVQKNQAYVMKFVTTQASKLLVQSHQRELNYYHQFANQDICLDYQILSLAQLEQGGERENFIDLASEVLVLPYCMSLKAKLKTLIVDHISIAQRLLIFNQCCTVLIKLHESGYVHGDLKLQHYVWMQATLKLIDFAQVQKNDQAFGVELRGGTPAYMAPELFLGHNKTVQTDIYALGIIFYQILTGQKPFQAYTYQDWAIQHCQQMIPLLPLPLRPYQKILDSMLAKHTKNRFLTVCAIENALNVIPI